MADSTDEFNALMGQSRFAAALVLAERSMNRQQRSSQWPRGAGRAALALGRLGDAHEYFERALRIDPKDAESRLQIAIVDHRLGRSARAEQRLRALLTSDPANAVDANMALAEVLHRTNQVEALTAHFSRGGEWLNDPRALLFRARLDAKRDTPAAIERLKALARSDAPSYLRRIAGFEAVKLLDRTARYREAFDLATQLHQSTGGQFDLGGLEAEIAAQRAVIDRTAGVAARAPRVAGTAMIVALPRSGTTLLEQMLDRHLSVSGIGEYEGIQSMGERAVASGLWPRDLGSLSTDDALGWQRAYFEGSVVRRRAGASVTLDKSLHTWMWLPLIAAIMPGCVLFSIDRDPRDTAISTLLGNFHPASFGWTSSLSSIRTVIATHRSFVPHALERLDLAHESIKYESLVDDPAGHAARCLARLDLPMDLATTAPEGNTRTVLTLSHEQVRQPINRASIGRWKNYEWAFDAQWNQFDS